MKISIPLRLLAAGVLAALAITGMLYQYGPNAGAAAQTRPQKIIVHLSSYTNDLHAAFMAVKLAGAMQQKGAKVTLMVDLEGVRLIDARLPQDLRWGTETPMSVYYDEFIKAGGAVLVCPHCAHAAGIDEKRLRAGARIGKEGELAQAILDADKILDY